MSNPSIAEVLAFKFPEAFRLDQIQCSMIEGEVAISTWDEAAIGRSRPTGEEIAAWVTEFSAQPAQPSSIKTAAIIRFLVAAGIVTTTATSVAINSVSRISVGRYRIYYSDADPDKLLIPSASLQDTAVRSVRGTARTAAYAEIRIVDAAGVAADAAEVTVRLDKIVAQ